MKTLFKPLLLASLLASLPLAASAAEKVRLEYWTMNLSPTFADWAKNATAEFNRQNPNLEAVWVDMNWDQIRPKLIASLAAGTPPALVNFNVPWVHEFAAQGNLQPLDPLIGNAKDVYLPAAVKDVSANGKMYAFPFYNSVSVLAYNQELFAKAGIKEAPRNFAEFISTARTVTAKTGVPAFSPKLAPESGGGVIGWFYYAGLPVIDKGRAVFTSPQHVALVQQFADLYKAGVIPRDAYKMEFEQEIAAYSSGRLAMMTTAPQAIKRLETNAKARYDQTGIAPFPTDKGQRAFGAWMMDFVIPKGAKNPADAAKLGLFLTSDAQQLAFSKATETTFPSTKKANLDPYFQAGASSRDPVERARAVAARSMEFAVVVNIPPGTLPDETTMMRKFNDEMQQAIEGRKPVKAALDAAAAAWNARLVK